MNLFFDISDIDFLENLILKEIPLEEILTIIVIDSLLPTLIIWGNAQNSKFHESVLLIW